MTETTFVDGFYSAYFTGIAGNSMGMFVFRDGVLAGADIGGGRYDGVYALSPDGKKIISNINFILPVGSFPITGVASETQPMSVSMTLELPIEFNRHDVHRLETPLGPINAKFEKIRGA
ncbi:Hypothetical protein RG1141_CH18770 [Neorhizobium galegae bv. officinalis bv. officinalis str. HAMBI 1141]|uniref:Uncharacterized protein n=1 Tax=Neorhizobium galegae bv. officinalis bv. officinalis str. HAMBI 1141 TaxID=1028801 RepID=A0A068T6Q7_NEOGA|nr:hypothetical protein [Neorhizobium galegae]CDN54217.1 Hypothetical protein RG1141_CH18770 [Neorhizobium galegae bv. officinalis bv. officinalis str. HAMBI 1141]